jgi:predicted Rossmann fold flavoprotein
MPTTPYDVIIIGGGAAGLMCAARLEGRSVLVLDGKERPARKLLITGGGRCNLTNSRVTEKDFATHCPRVLRHVLRVFPSKEVAAYFEGRGIAFTIDEAGQYFTADGRAGLVVDALITGAREAGAEVRCGARVAGIAFEEGLFRVWGEGFTVMGRNVVVATGGLSYPATGSDGAGFVIARQFGHTLIATAPALTPFLTDNAVYQTLAGLTLPVRLTLWDHGRKEREQEGAFLFTHTGFSGPLALDMSRHWLAASEKKRLVADFAPSFTEEKFEALLMDDAQMSGAGLRLTALFPKRLAAFLMERAGVDNSKPAQALKREERKRLVAAVKAHELPVTGTMGYDKAEATSGGVDLNEMNGAALESRFQPGLFFAGEVLDVDGRVGGFNLQWAWASAAAVAQAIIKKG